MSQQTVYYKILRMASCKTLVPEMIPIATREYNIWYVVQQVMKPRWLQRIFLPLKGWRLSTQVYKVGLFIHPISLITLIQSKIKLEILIYSSLHY